jgi:sRNA-binding carbon storage regulator CsrA
MAHGDGVRLRIAAPEHVRIDRKEIHERREVFDVESLPKV